MLHLNHDFESRCRETIKYFCKENKITISEFTDMGTYDQYTFEISPEDFEMLKRYVNVVHPPKREEDENDIISIHRMKNHPKSLRLSPVSNFYTEDNPISVEVYMVLEEMDIETVGEVREYLNTISPNLTVCPKCHVDDFVHVASCELYKRWKPEEE